MTSSREAQGQWIPMLTFARCKEARCERYDRPCGALTGRGTSSYGVGFKALGRSSVLGVTARKVLLCFAPRVFEHPFTRRVSGACPVGGGARCAGCELNARVGKGKKNHSVAVTLLGCTCEVTKVN